MCKTCVFKYFGCFFVIQDIKLTFMCCMSINLYKLFQHLKRLANEKPLTREWRKAKNSHHFPYVGFIFVLQVSVFAETT